MNSNDKYISFRESIKKFNKMNENEPRNILNTEIIKLRIILSMALQKLEKLGILQEFYDDIDMPMDLREYFNGLKNSFERMRDDKL